jgi:hypothetical protein
MNLRERIEALEPARSSDYGEAYYSCGYRQCRADVLALVGEASKPRRVLLLCSYCDDDSPDCSNELPCPECLLMCNIAIAPSIEAVEESLGYQMKMKRVCKNHLTPKGEA